MKSLPVLLTVLAASGATGCFWVTTKSEGKSLRRDVAQLDERVRGKEDEIDGQVSELKRVIDEATKVLKRNSADLGADVEALRNDIRVSTGLVSAAKNMIDDLSVQVDAYKAANDDRLTIIEARLNALEGGHPVGTTPTGTTPAGMNPDDLWTQGTAAFKAQKWDEARDAYKKLAVGFPTHDRADDAQYFRGESYFQQADWDSAIREFQKVYDKFASSALADDALFRAAESAAKLKNCSEARAYLSLLKQKYASSNLAAKATSMDKDLKASAKTKSKCTS
ncbi:MAG: tetratricopeptide repeat protein [Kofleriaceae bacterium]